MAITTEMLLEKMEQELAKAKQAMPKTVLKPEPLKMEDGANGDSIFDF